VCVVLLLPHLAHAGRQHPEKYYQDKWCTEANGRQNVRMPDGTRCDCLTTTHAVELDFGSKWAESIGQSLYYSLQTGQRAGVGLILERDADYKYWLRLNTVIKQYNLPIDTWMIK